MPRPKFKSPQPKSATVTRRSQAGTSKKEPVVKSKNKRKPAPAASVWEHLRSLLKEKLQNEALYLFEVTNLCNRNGQFVLPDDLEQIETLYLIAKAYCDTWQYPISDYWHIKLIDSFPLPMDDLEFVDVETDFTEEGIRFSHYQCLMEMGKFTEAYCELTKILERKDPPLEVVIAARELMEDSSKRKAKKTVYDRRPVKFDDSILRINLPVLGSASYVMSVNAKTIIEELGLPEYLIEQFEGPEKSDITLWLKAQECKGKYELKEAIKHLENMSHRNSRVMCEIAKLHRRCGRINESRRTLLAIRHRDAHWVEGMDLLAYLLSHDEKTYGPELSALSTYLLEKWANRPEAYVANGYMSRYFDSHQAFQYGTRALALSEPGTEQFAQAALLKNSCFSLQSADRSSEAIDLLKDALRYDSYNIDLNRALIDRYMANDACRDAKNFVTALVHNNPLDIQAKLLKVHVFINADLRARDSSVSKDLLKSLEEILMVQPSFISPIIDLLQDFFKTKQTEHCESLLNFLTKIKHMIPHDKVALYYKLKSDHFLINHDTINTYDCLVTALALGERISQTQMSELESEFRIYGQQLLDKQFHISDDDPLFSDSSDDTLVRSSCSYNLRSRRFTKKTGSRRSSGAQSHEGAGASSSSLTDVRLEDQVAFLHRRGQQQQQQPARHAEMPAILADLPVDAQNENEGDESSSSSSSSGIIGQMGGFLEDNEEDVAAAEAAAAEERNQQNQND